jgi:hypothetical protein
LPGVNRVALIGEAVPSADLVVPPLDEAHCTRYAVIAAPPLDAGAANITLALVRVEAVARTFVGRSGRVAGSVTVEEYVE